MTDAAGHVTAIHRLTTIYQTNDAGEVTGTLVTDAPVATTVITERDGWGVPTATITRYLAVYTTVVTLRDANGVATATTTLTSYYYGPRTRRPAATALVPTADITILRDGAGRPTATVRRTTEHLENNWGSVTGTLTAFVPVVTAAATLTDARGVATATTTGYARAPGDSNSDAWPSPDGAVPGGSRAQIRRPSGADYFAGSFAAVLLATALAVPVQVLDTHIKSLLPFHALTRPDTSGRGATAADSLLLAPGGLAGVLGSVRLAIRFGEPLALLSDALVACGAMLTTLSGEAVGFRVFGDCYGNVGDMCVMSLTLVDAPTRAAEALVAAMALLVLLIAACLVVGDGWRSGLAASPWSIAGVAALLAGSETCGELQAALLEASAAAQAAGALKGAVARLTAEQALKQALAGKMFALGYAAREDCEDGADGVPPRYGIVVVSDRTRRQRETPSARMQSGSDYRSGTLVSRWRTNSLAAIKKPAALLGRASPVVLGMAATALFITVLCAFLGMILYYETTQREAPFDKFMNNQEFGVGFLFTGFGVAMGFFWDNFFSYTAVISPYRQLASGRPQPQATLLAPRATEPFTGLWRSARRGDGFGAAVAGVTILSKFAPIALANIPFRSTLTWRAHQVCAWSSVATLLLMIALLGISLARFNGSSAMPVSPDTIARCLYYVCDSHMLRDFDGLSTLDDAAMARRLACMPQRYTFGPAVGVSGRPRVGIDYAVGDEKAVLR
ncbi:hypothetical protein B0T24DRAFT_522884 [Lasiosphaeria ovina]|uniref:Uncharacterized protein n=1 Tax=Lasiosphaeria ovina TaxID=92902 RepID=A0AAE0KLV4_9PEZI|nr:hypothetical protein B0T24DRAFT_522884 [Lasiosphaeria ovina]